MRRIEREITSRAEIINILNESHVMRIAITDELYPYILPLNFAHTISPDGLFRFFFHSAANGRKTSLLKRNGRVGFETDILYQVSNESDKPCEWSTVYQSVVGTGRVKIVMDEDEKRAGMNMLVSRYANGRELQDFNPQSFENVLVLQLDVESITGKKHLF